MPVAVLSDNALRALSRRLDALGRDDVLVHRTWRITRALARDAFWLEGPAGALFRVDADARPAQHIRRIIRGQKQP